MPGNNPDSAGTQNLVHLRFTMKSFDSIEEFDGCKAIRALDEAILAWSWPHKAKQSAAVTIFKLLDARISHASLR